MDDFICEKRGLDITWKLKNFNHLAKHSYCLSPKFEIGSSKQTKWVLKLDKSLNCFLNLKRENSDGPSLITIESNVLFCNRLGKKLPLHNIINCTIAYDFPNPYGKPIGHSFIPDYDFEIRLNLRDISSSDTTVYRCFFKSLVEVEQRKGQFIFPNNLNNLFDTKNEFFFHLPSLSKDSIPFSFKIIVSDSKIIVIKIEKTKGDINSAVTVLCNLSFENTKQEKILSAQHSYEFLHEKGKTWDFPTNFDFEILKSHLRKENILYLNYELSICEQKQTTWLKKYEVVPCKSNHYHMKSIDKEKANLRDDLMCLYVEQKCPDVEIIASGKKFPAHKSILSARSPVFNAMFENNMLEKEKNLVEISDLDAETVDKMLFFMYSEILKEQDWRCAIKLYNASEKYQILTLKDKCSEIIRKQLFTFNACEALILADKYHDAELLSSVQDYIVANSKSVFKLDGWQTLMDNQPKLACQVMHKSLQII